MSARARTSHEGYPGFTLLELMVAVLITAGIAGATLTTLMQSMRAREVSVARQQAWSRAQTAAERIAMDVSNVVRDGNLRHARIRIEGLDRGSRARDEILVYSRSLRQVRPTWSQNEGGTYEVQYRVAGPSGRADDDRGASGNLGAGQGMFLWRRADPVPDDVPEGGGVVTPLVEGVLGLSIAAFDGRNWRNEWDTDGQGYPHAVRIVVEAVSDDGRRRATARRVVSIDRVPLPYTPVEEDAIEAGGGGT